MRIVSAKVALVNFQRRLFAIGFDRRGVINHCDDQSVISYIAVQVSHNDIERHSCVAAINVLITGRIVAERIFICDCTIAGHWIVCDRGDDQRARFIVDDDLIVGVVAGFVVEINLNTINRDARNAIWRVEADC